MARAITSFPVPLSPVSRIVASVVRRFCTRLKRCAITAERAIMPEKTVGAIVPVLWSCSSLRTMRMYATRSSQIP